MSDRERRQLWLGLRFAPTLCLTGIAVGTALAFPATAVRDGCALGFLGGFITRKHPFDYAYDLAIRPLIGGPLVPDSPPSRRFACQLATPWIVAIGVAFLTATAIVAWILAVPLLIVGAVVSTTNWCLPSLIYGLLHRREPRGAGA